MITKTKEFKGECLGVVLEARNSDLNDSHIIFKIISQDFDGEWHELDEYGISSVWMDDLRKVLYEARQWMEENCLPDESGFGWKFKI